MATVGGRAEGLRHRRGRRRLGGRGGAAASAGGLYRSDRRRRPLEPQHARIPRITGSGYFSRVFLDPKNSDVVYVAQTSLYRSDDGGRTFSSYKGAPGGDDNHALWIDPPDSNRMIMASDQGATISMDGGKSWSSWYNQPTGQIYHLSTDNRYPYWVYGTQQDSGSVGTLSRGDYGEITFMDWDPVGGYEFGYIVPDPLNNNLVYAGGPSRGLVRIDRTNRQVATVSPSVGRGDNEYRMATNPPAGVFATRSARALHGGADPARDARWRLHWKAVSPDLTERPSSRRPPTARPRRAAPALPARPRAQEQQETIAPDNRAAINAFSLSPVAAGVIWAGTNNGIIQLTKDNGAHWQNVSPPGLSRLHADQHRGSLALRRRHRLRRCRPPRGERFPRALLPHPRLGKTWQEISRRYSRWQLRARSARRSGAQGPALRRNGKRRLCLVR